MMVTLALTVIVPVTVDPPVGAVMVTMRLPSWAEAGAGASPLPTTSSRNAATAARRAQDARGAVFFMVVRYLFGPQRSNSIADRLSSSRARGKRRGEESGRRHAGARHGGGKRTSRCRKRRRRP